MANFCVRYGNLVFVMANSKNVVFAMVKNRCVRYGCVRYDGTPLKSVQVSWLFLPLGEKLPLVVESYGSPFRGKGWPIFHPSS